MNIGSAEKGSNYNYFRDYDPGIGRYVESDPLGLTPGPNTYAYVGSTPLVYIDSTGQVRAAIGEIDKGINTVVCNGRGGVEVLLDDPMNSDVPCIVDCLKVHEASHRKDALRLNPTVCRGIPKGVGLSWEDREQLSSEERAHQAELKCLEAKLRANPCNRCKKQIENRIRDIKIEFLPYYKKGQDPFRFNPRLLGK